MRFGSKWAVLTIAAGSLACAQTCNYSLNPGGQAFTAQGGSGTVTITTGSGCPWSVVQLPPGITLTSPASGVGIGTGTATFQVAPNSGGDLSRSFTIAGQPFIVQQESAAIAGLNLIGSMAHLAAQENWTSTFTLVNKSSVSTTARLSLFGDAGNPSGNGPLLLPLSFPQQAAGSGPLLAASLDQALAANASLIVTTAGPQTQPVLVGSAQLAATGAVDGFAIFHQIPTGQEAVVPMETRNASSYLLPFDNTNGLVLGVAVENLSGQTASIPVIIRDDTGTIISAAGSSVSLGGNGHNAFVLSDPILGFPVTAGRRGTIEFDTPTGGRISVLGLRFTPPNNALTTIPALANVGVGGGSVPHLASGGDGWQTTFVLVNTGTSASSATLSFFNDQTGGPVSLPLSFPQSSSSPATPDLTMAESHSGSFVQGATGIYTITASNSGTVATSGMVTVTDTLPAGLTPTSASGTGWTCGIVTQTVTCTRTDALAAGTSYPAITLSVHVAGNATSITNVATVSGGGETNTANDSASDPTAITAAGGPPVSDDFNGPSLNPGLWTTLLSGGSSSLSGTQLKLTAPAGSNHDPSLGGVNNAVRVVQTVGNGDFTIETKFDSVPSEPSPSSFVAQGILVQQDSSNYFRLEFGSMGGVTYVAASTIIGGNQTNLPNVVFSPAGLTSVWMRIQKAGSVWTQSYSTDGIAFTTANSFTQALTVTAVGVYANNYGSPDNVATAFTAVVDYFHNGILPDLTITKSHSGSFVQGATGSYTITVSNGGTGATSGTVTVTDTLPAGLTPSGASGTGWTCGIATQAVTCTRTDALAAGSSYPAVTLSVTVAGNATSVTNVTIVAGGGESNTANDSASDSTTVGDPITAAPSVSRTIPAGGILLVTSSGAPSLLTGSAQVSSDGQVGGFAILRHNNQEAVVPLESRNASAYVLAFDNTNGTATGIAVNAVSTQQASIPVVVRDDTGTQIATDTLTLAANGHYAFTLANRYSVTANTRGTIEFDNPAGAQIGTIGIRIPAGAAHTYTTLPPLASNPTTVSTTSGAAVSDDFASSTLNRAWTFVNPQGDGVYSLKGSSILLSVPGTASHDPWISGDNSVRIMQPIANTDFAVEVKFRSTVDTSAPIQEQGIIVEQDAAHFLRFDIQSSNLQSFVFIANVAGALSTTVVDQEIRGGPANYMRLRRTGNSWSFSYSYDAYHWTPGFTFSQTLQVTKIGPYAGNASYFGQPAPAFTAIIDHFINLVSPPSTVDGGSYPPAPAAPAVQIWYGDSQTFGAPGVAQQWINILGNVADSNEIASLTYSLNGGPPQPLSTGEDANRLVDAGDFNAEIDYASLSPGSNTVVITAIDTQGFATIHGVSVNYAAGQTWPSSYSITSWPTNLQSAAQIVDGLWQTQPDGTVRTIQQGYDRLLDIGDRGTWKNYLVTAEVTINSRDAWSSAVGIIAGWQGHSAVQYGQTLSVQPRIGHPFPAWFSIFFGADPTPSTLRIWENTATIVEAPLATQARTLQTGVKYIFKCQVQQNGSGGSHFSFKVWPASSSEPSAWDLQADGELSQGSILLAVYRADVTFGQITITGL